MRVTDRLVFETATRETGQAREAAQQAQQAASTGMRVDHPGDDPSAASLIVYQRISAERFTAMSTATTAAQEELHTADAALDGVSNALSRARELAVQFSNSTYSAEQRQGAAEEVNGLLKQIVSSLNTRVGSRYVFGGSRDDAPPFKYDEATGSTTYDGAADVRRVEIAPGVTEKASMRLDDALGVPPTPLPSQPSQPATGALKALQDLRAALGANDVNGVQATLTALEAGTTQVASVRSQAGVSMNLFGAAASAAKIASVGATQSVSKLGDADIAQAAIQLQATQTALQASYAATAKSFQLSILQYLS